MHLQQTKRESRETGGPQYYFHALDRAVKSYLRDVGAVRVALVTPYGATKSDYSAISKDRKLDADGRLTRGNVGHDRIQQGSASESIGESIRKWYNLSSGDFERIDVRIEIRDDKFYLAPLSYRYVGKKDRTIPRIERPLTFTQDYASRFWKEQLAQVSRHDPKLVRWAFDEICRVVSDHRPASRLRNIQEPDLLRASGPLAHLGVKLGGYVGKGYDCRSEFTFLDYPPYSVAVELKRNSRDFKYQQRKYPKEELSRAVVLCAIHDHSQMPLNIDVIELEALCAHTGSLNRVGGS